MRLNRALILGALLMSGGSGAVVCTASASGPSPAWSVHSVALPSSFNAADNELEGPGGTTSNDQYTISLTNVGGRASSGPVTVTDTLPAGLTTASTPRRIGEEPVVTEWSCTPGAGQTTVTCTTENSVPALTPANSIAVPVTVSPSAQGTLMNRIEVSGGEAPVPTGAVTPTPIAASRPPFGPVKFEALALDSAGAVDTTAAAHPNAFTTSFALTSINRFGTGTPAFSAFPVEAVKQIVSDLPPGLIGDALAAPTCSLTDVTNLQGRACAPATRVGTLSLIEEPGSQESGATSNLTVFNIAPERGYPAEFAVYDPKLQRAVLLYASVVGSGADAHVRVISGPQDSFVTVEGVSVTFFGNPAAVDRSGISPVAFFTSPSDCAASGFTSVLYVDSWEHPGRMGADGQPDLSDPNWRGASSVSPGVRGCEALQFHPTLSFAPEGGQGVADAPAGYEAVVRVPQNEDPNGLATPPLKSAVVTLPAGVAVSPGAADGLVGCPETGAEGLEPQSSDAGHCPLASKVASAEVVTPLLREPLAGSVFVAQPACGGAGQPVCSEEAAETGGVFALYLEVGSVNSGVHLKLKGSVEVGGSGVHSRETGLAPGQVRTTFADAPQQPFSELKLQFKGGPRAPLANPQGCGVFQASSELEPWSHLPAPGEAMGTPDATGPAQAFAISGCGGGFAPGFTAGTSNPLAGGYSPFSVTFSRQDREQNLVGVTLRMPPGLLGRIAGIPLCPEAQAQAGACSSASRIGSATAGVGSGSHPLWQSGQVYLTGPYKGAPFGLSIVVPADAGPFHLGNIVVRAAIAVDPHTAQITVTSDPFPQSVDGVPLRIKTVNTLIDREAFTFNPTNCEPLSVSGTLMSTQGASAGVASHFQAANCAALAFRPSFKVATQAHTSKKNGASLDVKVGYPSGGGQANIGKVAVTLPKQLPSRLTTIQQACPEATFNANPASCPAGSVIGTATASTPVLANPVSGPAYLVSHGGAAFPDLVLILQGEGVKLELIGSIDIKKQVTSSSFNSVPDAPISSFELTLPEGPHSGLATVLPAKAKGNLCGTSLEMPTTITGQNGAQIKQNTKIAVTGCLKAKKKTKKSKKHRKTKKK